MVLVVSGLAQIAVKVNSADSGRAECSIEEG
jgi:hypothetical protein